MMFLLTEKYPYELPPEQFESIMTNHIEEVS